MGAGFWGCMCNGSASITGAFTCSVRCLRRFSPHSDPTPALSPAPVLAAASCFDKRTEIDKKPRREKMPLSALSLFSPPPPPPGSLALSTRAERV